MPQKRPLSPPADRQCQPHVGGQLKSIPKSHERGIHLSPLTPVSWLPTRADRHCVVPLPGCPMPPAEHRAPAPPSLAGDDTYPQGAIFDRPGW